MIIEVQYSASVDCFVFYCRFKSSSLSHLQQSDFTLESSLSKSSADHLSGSQPTQVTDLEASDKSLCMPLHKSTLSMSVTVP